VPPVQARFDALDPTLANLFRRSAFEGSNGRNLLQVGNGTDSVSPQQLGGFVETQLSKALAQGKTEIAGVSKRPFKLGLKLTAFLGTDDGGDEIGYLQDRLFPALASMLARSIRVCTHHVTVYAESLVEAPNVVRKHPSQ
jgi:hypothetical protein